VSARTRALTFAPAVVAPMLVVPMLVVLALVLAPRVAVAADAAPVGSGTAPAPKFAASGRTIRVPSDATTIQAGVDRARPGDLVLISPGVYHEAVSVTTKGIVLRGVDRNRTILDGDFKRDNGIEVSDADGVAIENLTARNYTENGFYWESVRGYRGSYLTAYRNGDYGIYAFDSQWGIFDHSYASGSPDSGFYIGQCNPCHAVITDVVSEYNELGYSGTNAGGDLLIVRSVFRNNRAGVVPNSLDSEKLSPQGHATIAGNLVVANGSTKAAQAAHEFFDIVYGVGIVVVGGSDNEIIRNRVVGNALIGIAIAPNPGLGATSYPATTNQVRDNFVSGSSLADLAVVLATPADGNCFAGNQFATSAPTHLEQLKPCEGVGVGDPNDGALAITRFIDPSTNPKGRVYKSTPIPRRQPNLAHAKTAKARPAGAPPKITMSAITRPS